MLKVGFSRVDITCPLGTHLEGYFDNDRPMLGMLDPLYLNAVAFEDEGERALFITADMIQIRKKYADIIRELISEKTGVKEELIFISALHQHTSFGLRDITAKNAAIKDKVFMEMVYRRFVDVSLMALDDMEEAEVESAEKETAEQLAFIRRYVMNDGTVMTFPLSRRNEIVRPCRESDNMVRLLRFKREKGDIAMVNFSTHPDVVHGQYVSADWPGFVRTYLERDLGIKCIATVGAQGDSNHMEFMAKEYKDGYEHSKHMGRVIADTVISLWDNMTKVEDTAISGGIDIVFSRTRTDGEEKYEESKKILDDYYSGAECAKNYRITELGAATRIVNLKSAPIYQQVPVSVLNIGKIGFVGFGGEPFTSYADAVREACPDRIILTSCCVNGGEGYLPTKEAFHVIGYEAGSSPFSDTLEEECVSLAKKLLK